MERVRQIVKGAVFYFSLIIVRNVLQQSLLLFFLFLDMPDLDPNEYYPDNRYNHLAQVQERLMFLRFLLKVCYFTIYFYVIRLNVNINES